MSKFHIEFIVDKTKLGDLHEALHPLKVENLHQRLVAGTSSKVRAGDKPGSQIVYELATDKPQPSAVFREALHKAGFKNANTAIDQAMRKKLIRKVKIKGALHLVRAKGG